MSIKTEAIEIRDETTTGANSATRIGTNLVNIADDLIAKQSAISLNTAKVGITTTQASNITSNNTKISYTDAAAVALNTLKTSNVSHPLVQKEVPSNAVFTDTVYNDSNVLKDADALSPVTGGNKLITEIDVAALGGGDMLASTYDPIINLNTAKTGITTQQASDITTNNAKVSNIAHPLVETAVPLGAIFTDTDTVYNDTAIQSEVDLNTAKRTYPSVDEAKLGLIEAGATNDTTGTIQTKRPLKTVNGSSLEGSGNVDITGSADAVIADLVVTATKTIDWSSGETFNFVVTGSTVFSDSGLPSLGFSKVITLYMTGDFAVTFPSGWDTNKTGTYDGTVLNTITIEYVNTTTPFHKVTIV